MYCCKAQGAKASIRPVNTAEVSILKLSQYKCGFKAHLHNISMLQKAYDSDCGHTCLDYPEARFLVVCDPSMNEL
jgi:hypothetical protein